MKALKRFGQNFLVDKNILAQIISRSGACENDCVLEIGPGHGVLTRALLAQNVKCLHVIELDERLKPELEELALSEQKLIIHWGDAVKFDYETLKPFPDKIIANIPYNITTPLIWKLLRYDVRYMLFMLQKEAALRLTAKPDTKARYPLGVTIEAMGRAEIVKNVSRECFRPIPEVDSALVEIKLTENFELVNNPLWSEILHKGFSHRRKTLLNNFRGFIDASTLGEYAKMRAEDLTCEEWLAIYERVKRTPPHE
ncbi:MAG: ribosomal RNA small subunit methyltransferase A [Synergistaceae bacterium]|nr:ribosomal RNA small subunit methyltransferase A [Synergistaceae bacterium]